MRKLHTKRYQKQVPGHHIQVDVKFLTFRGKRGEKVRRFQYNAIDDATRFRALKVYEKHTQANAIDFIDHIIEKFPFRIREVRTDNGHEDTLALYRTKSFSPILLPLVPTPAPPRRAPCFGRW